MTIEEVLETARAGALQGCTEALFTLGEISAIDTSLRSTAVSAPPCERQGFEQHVLSAQTDHGSLHGV